MKKFITILLLLFLFRVDCVRSGSMLPMHCFVVAETTTQAVTIVKDYLKEIGWAEDTFVDCVNIMASDKDGNYYILLIKK